MLSAIDRLCALAGRAAAWLFLATGAMLTYEVVVRYVFNAPTIWAEELGRLLLVWGTYLGMALLIRRRQHIRITVFLRMAGPRALAAAEAFSLLFIVAFCAVTVWYGTDIAWDSLVKNRSTGTMLNIPNWWSEAAVPLCAALLLLQCCAELTRLASGAPPPPLQESSDP